jgi:rRNA small subunit pseudouridine methyltransferase Nep1
MLTLVLAESSIERVPKQLAEHPSVIAQAQRRGKPPGSLILDRSYHHSGMRMLERQDPSQAFEKRGRPDIAFHILLQVLGSPLNREGLLRTYVHTTEDKVIEIDPQIRLPRNYDRFVGLLEQLYEQGSVPTGEHPLLRIQDCTLTRLVDESRASMTIAFSTVGESTTMKDACSLMTGTSAPVVLIGGFAHSHFEQSTTKIADHIFSVDKEPLDAWIVAARVVYEYECGMKLPKKRLRVTEGRAFNNRPS